MLLNIQHTTHYSYENPVNYALQQIRLTPKSTAGQNIINWKMSYTGGKKELEYTDHHNNTTLVLSTHENATEFEIHCIGEVETSNRTGIIGRHSGDVPLWYFFRQSKITKAGPRIEELIESLKGTERDDITLLHALSEFIRDKAAYKIGSTHVITTAEQALELGSGVCQDHAHIFITAARLLGYPARYVSGYLMMNDRIDQDASHAWAEAYIKSIGWVGFDISNGISPDERYIRVATGLDYVDASPISGMRFGDGDEKMVVKVQVQQ